MKERILHNWNLQRGIFTVVGLVILSESIYDKEWMGAILGTYLMTMGILKFGCAAGGCCGTSDSCSYQAPKTEKTS